MADRVVWLNRIRGSHKGWCGQRNCALLVPRCMWCALLLRRNNQLRSGEKRFFKTNAFHEGTCASCEVRSHCFCAQVGCGFTEHNVAESVQSAANLCHQHTEPIGLTCVQLHCSQYSSARGRVLVGTKVRDCAPVQLTVTQTTPVTKAGLLVLAMRLAEGLGSLH